MRGPKPSAWMVRVEQEIDNLRAVLQWLIAHRPEEGLQMTLNLFWFWQSTNYLQEGCDWFSSALAHTESASPALRAQAYNQAGFLAICMNRIAAAENLLAHSFATLSDTRYSDPQVADGLASMLNRQSLVPLFQGDYTATLRITHQAIELARQVAASREVGSSYFFAAEAFYHQGLFAQSKCYYEESLVKFRPVGICAAVGAD